MIGVAAITVRWFPCWVHSRGWFQQAQQRVEASLGCMEVR